MQLEQWQTKPPWEHYEAALMSKGFVPRFEPQEAPLPITCCRCGAVPAYIVMTDGATTLGFLACGPECGEWIGSPLASRSGGA
jgi:hypothetical protein